MNCIECDNPVVEFNGLCASCNHAHRKAEREAKKIKVIKPVKKVSGKRADELTKYPKLKKDFLEHKMVCEFRLDGCTITATQPHHCSLLAKNFLNTDTWKACCLSCHIRVEALPSEQRRELGLLTD
jgi:hypothetical protein